MARPKLTPRLQGDVGELSAMQWLASRGARIYVPVGHSPDVDLVALAGGRTMRVEVKTSDDRVGANWGVIISTRGGNRSWTGLVKSIRAVATFSSSMSATAGGGSSRPPTSSADRS